MMTLSSQTVDRMAYFALVSCSYVVCVTPPLLILVAAALGAPLEAVRVEADEDVEVGGVEDAGEARLLLVPGQQQPGQLQQQLPAHGLVT